MTLVLGVVVVLSAGMWFVFVLAFPGFLPNGSTYELFKNPIFWSLLLLVPVTVALRDFVWKFYRRQFRPHPYHIVQEFKLTESVKEGQTRERSSSNLVFEGTDRKPRRSRGFSFSQTYGQSKVLTAYGQSPKLSSNLRQPCVSKDDLLN